MRREWDITQDAFDRFLNWLDPNREQAGAKYEDIRSKLIRFFACRGWGVESEELTDETLARVVKKIQEIADSYVGDPLHYFLKFAHYVHHEQLQLQERLRRMRAVLPQPVTDSSGQKERSDYCLEQCMTEVTPENRILILKYYRGDKHEKIIHRNELAEELAIAPNALRIRAHRIRTDLRRCVENCLAEENDDETYSGNAH
jgi:DNA-directed RNA polymerase specialized sigma24 family protein